MGMEMEAAKQNVSHTVEQLVAVNPYNPDILPDLENYVHEQCNNMWEYVWSNPDIIIDLENYVEEQVSKQTWSLDANLCLLRLYQFDPERMNIQVVVQILIKALMEMPTPDFNLCLFLIPERVQMEEQIKTLIVLSHYMETARFRQFWDEAAKNRHTLESIPGFEEAIRGYAVHILLISYKKVPRSVLAEVVNIEGMSLDKFIQNKGWSIEKEEIRTQLIVLPSTEFNSPETEVETFSKISLAHVTRIFPILN